MKISAVIITRNEEKNLSDCIATLSVAGEIIVVDNLSIDGTRVIAKKLGAEVFEIAGLDFSYLRNIGKEKATGDWLLYIDADERITQELAVEIKEALQNPGDYAAFSLVRQNYFLGRESPVLERFARLIKKDKLIGWQGSLHESPIIAGKTGRLKNKMLHFTHRDISGMVAKTNEWSEIEAQLLYKSHHPTMQNWRFARVMITAFWRSYVKNQCWKMGTVGFIESIYQAFSSFITYAKLWEKQSNHNRNDKSSNL